MRGLTLTLPMVALIGLTACVGQPTTMAVSESSSPPAGFRQSECLELQQKMEDPSFPVFTRNGARDDFNRKDCVYRNVETSNNLLAAILAPVGNP